MNSSREPKKSDAVLGGSAALPAQSVVLGGLIGVKQRLYTAQDVDQRQAALRSALSYGKQGQEIILGFLRDDDRQMRWFAHDLLCNFTDPAVKKALRLFSPSGTYYADLQELLQTKRWAAANEWTKQVMLKLGRAPLQLNTGNVGNIMCEDLQLIDRLWQKYSNGKFGFTAQSEIWERCQQLRWDENQALGIFGDRVGWRNSNFWLETYYWKPYEELTFSDRAPKGHLPWINSIFVIRAIHDRLLSCRQNAPESC